MFVTADTAGTKANDAVADGTLKHLGKVRPALKSMTENELESYSYLLRPACSRTDRAVSIKTH